MRTRLNNRGLQSTILPSLTQQPDRKITSLIPFPCNNPETAKYEMIDCLTLFRPIPHPPLLESRDYGRVGEEKSEVGDLESSDKAQ